LDHDGRRDPDPPVLGQPGGGQQRAEHQREDDRQDRRLDRVEQAPQQLPLHARVGERRPHGAFELVLVGELPQRHRDYAGEHQPADDGPDENPPLGPRPRNVIKHRTHRESASFRSKRWKTPETARVTTTIPERIASATKHAVFMPSANTAKTKNVFTPRPSTWVNWMFSTGKPCDTPRKIRVSGVLRTTLTYAVPAPRSTGTGETRIAAIS